MAIVISTWNVKGSNNVVKKSQMMNITNTVENGLVKFFSSYSTNKRGFITLIHKNLSFTVTATHKDNEGRYILVKGMLNGETVLLDNIYAPNAQDDEFYTVLFSQLVVMDCANIILAGDFNCVLCPKMDQLPPQSTLTKNSKALWQIVNELDLMGVWRHYNPLSKEYTFHSNPHLSASRIDYIFITLSLLDEKCIHFITEQTTLFLEILL
uniref:exodeoxyribonuclease III n=1 Tax=Pundamilia nyererei TaxID=303518 RepID=A0A3B4FC99_9CICH